MMNHTELFVLLLLLPVFAQIIIPLGMLSVFLFLKSGKKIISVFAKGTTDKYKDRPGLMTNKAVNTEA